MKYELEPDNRNCSDEVLLNDLKLVAKRLGRSSLSFEEYNRSGRFSPSTIVRRFGSWNLALEKCDLIIRCRKNIPPNELLDDLKRVAAILGTDSVMRDEYKTHGNFADNTISEAFGSWNLGLEKAGLFTKSRKNIPRNELLADLRRIADFLSARTVTTNEYRSHGKFADKTLKEKFGSWAKALAEAGLRPTGWKPKATEDELLQNMASVWESIGRQPRVSDFQPPVSRFSAATYAKYFGSFRKALEAFVASINDDKTEEIKEPLTRLSSLRNVTPETETKEKDVTRGIPAEPLLFSKVVILKVVRRKTPRQAGWRLRHQVIMRDGCRCQNCGRSPANEPGVTLEIDHNIPWSKGGETVLSNLRTLCQRCNGGKSNLTI